MISYIHIRTFTYLENLFLVLSLINIHSSWMVTNGKCLCVLSHFFLPVTPKTIIIVVCYRVTQVNIFINNIILVCLYWRTRTNSVALINFHVTTPQKHEINAFNFSLNLFRLTHKIASVIAFNTFRPSYHILFRVVSNIMPF